jgi:hypothetical protein
MLSATSPLARLSRGGDVIAATDGPATPRPDTPTDSRLLEEAVDTLPAAPPAVALPLVVDAPNMDEEDARACIPCTGNTLGDFDRDDR